MSDFFLAIPGRSIRLPRLAVPGLAIVVSGALLAGAHAFEKIGGYVPCALCLEQRETHWLALAVGIVALIGLWRLTQPLVRLVFLTALVLAYLWASGSAGYHVGVEFGWWPGPADCGSNLGGFDYSGDLLDSLKQETKAVPCDEVAWRFLGLSMAMYNFLISLGVMAVFLSILIVEFRLTFGRHGIDKLNPL